MGIVGKTTIFDKRKEIIRSDKSTYEKIKEKYGDDSESTESSNCVSIHDDSEKISNSS